MKVQIKELEERIQKEIWRRQMMETETLSTSSELHKMQKELKELKRTYKSSDCIFTLENLMFANGCG